MLLGVQKKSALRAGNWEKNSTSPASRPPGGEVCWQRLHQSPNFSFLGDLERSLGMTVFLGRRWINGREDQGVRRRLGVQGAHGVHHDDLDLEDDQRGGDGHDANHPPHRPSILPNDMLRSTGDHVLLSEKQTVSSPVGTQKLKLDPEFQLKKKRSVTICWGVEGNDFSPRPGGGGSETLRNT